MRPGKPPGNVEAAPGDKDGLTDTTQLPPQNLKSGSTIRGRTDNSTRRHSSPFCRWRHFNMNRRRREHLEFKDLLARLEPQTCNALHSSPADFGLTPDELRREANRLVRDYGWTIPEVCAVLDVESP